jgi:two-component system sensor histidine kinase KdpD
MHKVDPNAGNAHLVLVLAVLMVSRFTDGYLWGVFASLLACFIANYMFTYPYFHFNLTISGYLLSFIVNLSVSLIVSVMNTRIKQQENMRITAERERLRTDLFRAVSHDLRTPLTSIIGSTSAVLENELSHEKQLELISDVNTEAQWLLRMVENLLAVTRVSQNAQPLQLQTEVVEEVLADSVIKFRNHFANINVELETPDDVLFADIEPVLIGQVLTNILENAAYHGEHTDLIKISLTRSNGTIIISVSDNGVGIPPEQLANIFIENDVSARRRGAE